MWKVLRWGLIYSCASAALEEALGEKEVPKGPVRQPVLGEPAVQTPLNIKAHWCMLLPADSVRSHSAGSGDNINSASSVDWMDPLLDL